jgi:hypothetical protein
MQETVPEGALDRNEVLSVCFVDYVRHIQRDTSVQGGNVGKGFYGRLAFGV